MHPTIPADALGVILLNVSLAGVTPPALKIGFQFIRNVESPVNARTSLYKPAQMLNWVVYKYFLDYLKFDERVDFADSDEWGVTRSLLL